MKKDAFAKKMNAVEKLAERQGARTKRERAMFVLGFCFGTADVLTSWDLVRKPKRRAAKAGAHE